MIGDGPLNGFRVQPRNIHSIRQSANAVRELLGIGDNIKELSMSRFLDDLASYGVTYDVLEEDDMPHVGVEACCDPQNLLLCLREDVFVRACINDPRARFTIMHEFGHLLLGHARTTNRTESSVRPPRVFEDSEWQANQFAAEILMPLNMIKEKELKTEWDIMHHFNVSEPAAAIRVRQLRKRNEMES